MDNMHNVSVKLGQEQLRRTLSKSQIQNLNRFPQADPGQPWLALASAFLLAPLFTLSSCCFSWKASTFHLTRKWTSKDSLQRKNSLRNNDLKRKSLKNFLLCFAAIFRPMIIDCYKKRFSNGNMLILFLREFEWPSCDYLPLSRQIGGLDAVVSWVLSRYPSHRANSVSTSLSEPMTVVNKRAVEMNSEMKTAQTDRYS